MKKIVRLTESDLIRIVKRVIKEDQDVWADNKTLISQGYGKDPYQYKAVSHDILSPWGTKSHVEYDYYVAKKGPNPKWNKVTDKKAIDTIKNSQFPGQATDKGHSGGLETHDINRDTGKLEKVTLTSRGDRQRAFANIFPCVERAMKPTDKKEFGSEFVSYIIDGIHYTVNRTEDTKSGWEIVASDPKEDMLHQKHIRYKSCEEFNNRNKTKKPINIR